LEEEDQEAGPSPPFANYATGFGMTRRGEEAARPDKVGMNSGRRYTVEEADRDAAGAAGPSPPFANCATGFPSTTLPSQDAFRASRAGGMTECGA